MTSSSRIPASAAFFALSALAAVALLGASTVSASSYEDSIVNFHNKYRAVHGVGSMSWNQAAATYASEYLQKVATPSQCTFQHSSNGDGPYGENLALGYQSSDEALQAWYDEGKQYNYQAGQFGENTGHFTQMMWKGSTSLGCATTKCGSLNTEYLVCEYSPTGNIIGQFTQNVFPAR